MSRDQSVGSDYSYSGDHTLFFFFADTGVFQLAFIQNTVHNTVWVVMLTVSQGCKSFNASDNKL